MLLLLLSLGFLKEFTEADHRRMHRDGVRHAHVKAKAARYGTRRDGRRYRKR